MQIKKISLFAANFLLASTMLSPINGFSQSKKAVSALALAAVQGSPLNAQSDESAPRLPSARTVTHYLAYENGITMRGVDSENRFEFGVRKDEIVDSANLHLEYTFSPALLPQISHLRILLNEQVIQTIALPQSELGKPQVLEIPLDPRYFADYNRMDIRFVGHYTLECENPNHSSLWAQLSNKSRIVLNVQQLKLANNLAQLPLPFFDPRDNSKLRTNFIFPDSPSIEVLQAAGVMAGWLGAQADFRKTQIQAFNGDLPKGHAIVFATATQYPDFLENIVKEVEEATLQLIEHPQNRAYQLLLVMGRDDAQLQVAAQALALGKVALTGNSTQIKDLELPQPRKPYDAPRWQKNQEPVELSNLVASSKDLQVKGYSLNTAITTYLRVAPDLFTWNNKHLPLELLYRYTPNAASADGRIEVMLNHNLVHSFPLESVNQTQRRLLPKFGFDNDQKTNKFYVPAEWLTANNRLDFLVKLPAQEMGSCFSQVPVEVRAEIDPKSTIDLSGLPHFIAMPNLQAYVQGGFPFSRLADLREMAVILPANVSAASTEAYLNAIAHISGVTGYPGTRFSVVSEKDAARIGDKDILLISDGQTSTLLEAWKQQLPALIISSTQSISLSQKAKDKLSELWDMRSTQTPSAGQAKFTTNGQLAALAGFESPLHSGRSVVALMSNSAEALGLIEKNINDNAMTGKFMGDLSLLNESEVESFRIQPTYFVGKLNLIERLWFKLHDYPVVLALIGCLIGMLFTFFVYASLRFIARRRLEQMA